MRREFARYLAVISAAGLLAGLAVASAPGARAADCFDPDPANLCAYPGWFAVQGTDGTLAVQSTDAVDHVIGWLNEGASVKVLCQQTDGSTDPYDGLSSRTWDRVYAYFNGRWDYGWVYDSFVSTPVQDNYGRSVNQLCYS